MGLRGREWHTCDTCLISVLWTAQSIGMCIFDVPVANKYRPTTFLEKDKKKVYSTWHIWGWKISGKLAFGTYIKESLVIAFLLQRPSRLRKRTKMEQLRLARHWGESEGLREAAWAADQARDPRSLLFLITTPLCSPFLLAFDLSPLTVSCGRIETGTLAHLYKVAESPLPFLNKQMKSIFV